MASVWIVPVDGRAPIDNSVIATMSVMLVRSLGGAIVNIKTQWPSRHKQKSPESLGSSPSMTRKSCVAAFDRKASYQGDCHQYCLREQTEPRTLFCDAAVYIGEAETIRNRLVSHKAKEFWVQAVAFASKDENLSKGHIKYLEGRLISQALEVGRAKLQISQASGSKLSESYEAGIRIDLHAGKTRRRECRLRIWTPTAISLALCQFCAKPSWK